MSARVLAARPEALGEVCFRDGDRRAHALLAGLAGIEQIQFDL
ncbi:hypothetical protein [Streptomyces sp. NPDC058664]